jgi:Mor family transcriptional regulator
MKIESIEGCVDVLHKLSDEEGKSIRSLAKEFKCSIGLIHKLINEHNK